MMKSKWIPITRNFELKDTTIITRKIKTGLDVTIGLPGYGLQNGTIAFMPLPKNINENPDAWRSEYRGDELPEIKENRCYMVQLQGTSGFYQGKFKIADLCYLAKEHRWLGVPPDWEIIGWTDYPKPFKE